MKKNILITGVPKSGKSTLIELVVEKNPNKVGFLTKEILRGDQRNGFEIEIYNGKKVMLASASVETDYKVSRYFVNVENLNSALSYVLSFNHDGLLYLDEIGQMQLYSEIFKQTCLSYLNSPNICLATVTKIYNDDFITLLKLRDDCIWVEVAENNRNDKRKFIEHIIEKINKAKLYISEPERFLVTRDKVIVNSKHGTRTVIINGDDLICDCNFYKKNAICSHTIAVEELIKNKN